MTEYTVALISLTFAAAIVNGALGYGFCSITVPVALQFLTNRVLNLALVPIEVVLNAYVLWVNRSAVPTVWRRVLPLGIGLAPGVALALIRLAESAFTASAYLCVGLFSIENAALMPQIIPSVALGVPIGAWLIRQVSAETFRRVCMSFDAWVVGFGISTLLRELRIVDSAAAYATLAAVITIDFWLLYRFFLRGAQPATVPGGAVPHKVPIC